MDFGLSLMAIGMFEHAVSLARGRENIRERDERGDLTTTTARGTVPIEDMRAAHAIATEVNEFLQHLVARFDRTNSNLPVVHRVVARDALGRAADGARMLVSDTRARLSSAGTSDEAHVVEGGLIIRYVTDVVAARQVMELVTGERKLADSIFAGVDDQFQEGVETILLFVPYLGEGMLIYEAAAGESLITGKKRSQNERVIAGIAVLLPHVLGAVFKKAAPIIGRAATITRRSVRIALEYKRVYGLLNAATRTKHAISIAIGMRRLPPKRFEEFLVLLGKVSREEALTFEEMKRVTYFFVRMSEDANTALWLRIAEKELGANISGFKKLGGARFTPEEERLLSDFAKHPKGGPVIGLPEIQPVDFPGTRKFAAGVKGVRYPDAIHNGELMDAVIIETEKGGGIVSRITDKASQAPTVLVGFSGKTTTSTVDVAAVVHRVFGNPNIPAVERVIIFDGLTVSVHTRSAEFIAPFMAGLAGISRTTAPRLMDVLKELEKEPD
jgi:hypothetical protein